MKNKLAFKEVCLYFKDKEIKPILIGDIVRKRLYKEYFKKNLKDKENNIHLDILLESKNSLNKTKKIVLDETYANFGEIDMSDFIKKYHNLVLVRSFSKDIGMAGLRIGYILSSEYLSLVMEKFKPMMEISSLAVEAIKTICSDKKYLKEATKEIILSRVNISNKFRKLGYEVLERKGNFILVDFKNDRKIIERILDNNNIRYRKFSKPLDNYIRFTVGTNEVMIKFFKIIQEGIKNEKRS